MLSSLHKHSIGAKRSSSSGVDEDKGMWYLVGVVAALLTTLGFVPQILKMRRTRSARDVSLVTLVQLAIGVVIWGVYGLHLKDPIIVSANAVSLFILITAIMLYFRYRGSEDISASHASTSANED